MEQVFEYKGYSVKVQMDLDSPNPVKEFDNLGTIALKENFSQFSNETIKDPIDWLEEKMGLHPKEEYNNERLNDLESKFFDEFIVKELYFYKHGGITVRTFPFECKWDSGKMGYIYMSKKTARNIYGWKRITSQRREKILNILKGEIEVLDMYLTGEVYGYTIEDPDGEFIDSCWGFYGNPENHIIPECKLIVNNIIAT